jgi:RNA polymerase sigma-70 factor (sigma-E family)
MASQALYRDEGRIVDAEMRMELLWNKAARREFEHFTAEAADSLLRTGFLMTGNAKDAEDLVQETLLKVASRWKRVRSMDHPAAYARRILINQVLQDADRRTRQRAELLPADGAAGLRDDNAAQALREVNDRAEFQWALRQLPARQRAVLVLRYWCDFPVSEVAEILGCAESTVTSTASRAGIRLADVLSHATPRV